MMHGGEISFQKKRSSHHDTARKMAETTLSLASGTFVLLVRLFLFCGGQSGRLPGSERRTAKMKIRYEFVNGEVSEIEVDEGLGELLVDFDRQQYNDYYHAWKPSLSLLRAISFLLQFSCLGASLKYYI